MKQIIIIVGTIVIIFIAAMTIVSVESKDLRTDELNRAVSASIKKTVSDSQIENQSTILSNKEMVAYFIQLLSVNMKGKGDVTVEVYDADYKEGLLSVAVTEKFKYVNGKNGEIKVSNSWIKIRCVLKSLSHHCAGTGGIRQFNL